MKLEFNSVEEVKEFVSQLKGKRGTGKGGDDETSTGTAPQPLMPPGTPLGVAGFQPQQAAGPFSTPAAAQFGGAAPEVMALVQRINAKIDGTAASGQSLDAAVAWFRGQCGPEAAAATMDQIKTGFLPRMSVPALENIAKLMGA